MKRLKAINKTNAPQEIHKIKETKLIQKGCSYEFNSNEVYSHELKRIEKIFVVKELKPVVKSNHKVNNKEEAENKPSEKRQKSAPSTSVNRN